VALSGAGAEGTNVINNDVSAYIDNGEVTSGPFDYRRTDSPGELAAGKKVLVETPQSGGSVDRKLYEYIGTRR
jgi:hypothetical protein